MVMKQDRCSVSCSRTGHRAPHPSPPLSPDPSPHSVLLSLPVTWRLSCLCQRQQISTRWTGQLGKGCSRMKHRTYAERTFELLTGESKTNSKWKAVVCVCVGGVLLTLFQRIKTKRFVTKKLHICFHELAHFERMTLLFNLLGWRTQNWAPPSLPCAVGQVTLLSPAFSGRESNPTNKKTQSKSWASGALGGLQLPSLLSGAGISRPGFTHECQVESNGSEFTLLYDLLHGLPKRHVPITTGQTLPGKKIQSCCITAHQTRTTGLSRSVCSGTSMHSHLKQVRVSCGSASFVVGVTLLRALRPVPPGALPQVLERCTMETAADLEVVGEEEKLPALLQFSLDLNTNK